MSLSDMLTAVSIVVVGISMGRKLGRIERSLELLTELPKNVRNLDRRVSRLEGHKVVVLPEERNGHGEL